VEGLDTVEGGRVRCSERDRLSERDWHGGMEGERKWKSMSKREQRSGVTGCGKVCQNMPDVSATVEMMSALQEKVGRAGKQ